MTVLRRIKLIDEDNNFISSQQQTNGDYHLGVSMAQDVYVDTNNSTSANLTSANSYTYTGTATSTLGVVGLQWSLKTDQNVTVYIEESPDGTNWDICYPFDYIASTGGRGETVQATQAYWRIRVVGTTSMTTTYFRLDAVLCPIATPLPSALSPDGRLQSESTLSGKENTDRHVWVSPTNTLSMNRTFRLVGTNFDGTTKDPNFWTETVTTSGTVVQTGEIKLNSGATSASSARYDSVRTARFVVGSDLQFTGAFKFNDALVADNIRRCGAYDNAEGVFFELSGTTFNVGSRKTSADTLVSNGSFNGNYGTTFIISPSAYYKLDIEWTPLGAFYYVNNKLLHKSVGGHLTRKLSLPIRFENINGNINTTNVVFDCLGVVISRQGELETNPTYKYIAGASTNILKYGSGTLHKVINNDNSGSVIVYDGISAGGDIIASIDLTKVLGSLAYDLPYSNGLTVVTTGALAKITVTYE